MLLLLKLEFFRLSMNASFSIGTKETLLLGNSIQTNSKFDSPPTTIHQLPTEILYKILDLASERHFIMTFKRMRLVNKKWDILSFKILSDTKFPLYHLNLPKISVFIKRNKEKLTSLNLIGLAQETNNFQSILEDCVNLKLLKLDKLTTTKCTKKYEKFFKRKDIPCVVLKGILKTAPIHNDLRIINFSNMYQLDEEAKFLLKEKFPNLKLEMCQRYTFPYKVMNSVSAAVEELYKEPNGWCSFLDTSENCFVLERPPGCKVIPAYDAYRTEKHKAMYYDRIDFSFCCFPTKEFQVSSLDKRKLIVSSLEEARKKLQLMPDESYCIWQSHMNSDEFSITAKKNGNFTEPKKLLDYDLYNEITAYLKSHQIKADLTFTPTQPESLPYNINPVDPKPVKSIVKDSFEAINLLTQNYIPFDSVAIWSYNSENNITHWAWKGPGLFSEYDIHISKFTDVIYNIKKIKKIFFSILEEKIAFFKTYRLNNSVALFETFEDMQKSFKDLPSKTLIVWKKLGEDNHKFLYKKTNESEPVVERIVSFNILKDDIEASIQKAIQNGR